MLSENAREDVLHYRLVDTEDLGISEVDGFVFCRVNSDEPGPGKEIFSLFSLFSLFLTFCCFCFQEFTLLVMYHHIQFVNSTIDCTVML